MGWTRPNVRASGNGNRPWRSAISLFRSAESTMAGMATVSAGFAGGDSATGNGGDAWPPRAGSLCPPLQPVVAGDGRGQGINA